ncbi:terminase small subunit [Meiothermus granaticius]|uniref:Terminase small subunit n=1 Tax=Meiothermus granaticius NBRC 107808 TaxID=1227551 RepID=A0A399FDV0_9DEIN|nr:terminase small subunit [Meiothermus granaticius]RIH94006.1 Terminase small subunit [Meiothermus granaticius NBRC 107808]GEM88165.1 hypothetical protein MGR01S_27900 [Meiothermus granaticius NBRC 107808]
MPRHKAQANDPDGLTPQQRVFVENYLSTFNASEAYRKAGYKGAKGRDARAFASEILANPNVQNAIRAKMQAYALAYGAERERLIHRMLEFAFGSPEYYRKWGVKGPLYVLRAAELLGRWMGMEQPQPQAEGEKTLEALVESIRNLRQEQQRLEP